MLKTSSSTMVMSLWGKNLKTEFCKILICICHTLPQQQTWWEGCEKNQWYIPNNWMIQFNLFLYFTDIIIIQCIINQFLPTPIRSLNLLLGLGLPGAFLTSSSICWRNIIESMVTIPTEPFLNNLSWNWTNLNLIRGVFYATTGKNFA